MKKGTLLSVRANESFNFNEGLLVPEIELIFLSACPKYTPMKNSVGVKKEVEISEARIFINEQSLAVMERVVALARNRMNEMLKMSEKNAEEAAWRKKAPGK